MGQPPVATTRRPRMVEEDMPQSLAQVYVHLVFSTKNRTPWLGDADLRGRLEVKKYIQNQQQHHRRMSFQDEFRELCRRHGLELDEQYAWD
jgi:hypothetical protein